MSGLLHKIAELIVPSELQKEGSPRGQPTESDSRQFKAESPADLKEEYKPIITSDVERHAFPVPLPSVHTVSPALETALKPATPSLANIPPLSTTPTKTTVELDPLIKPRTVTSWTCFNAKDSLRLHRHEAPPLHPNQVEVRIEYCGVCHSDVAFWRNQLNVTEYPCAAGHEIIGVVSQVGAEVRHLPVGARVGVGPVKSSCYACESCTGGNDNVCDRCEAVCAERGAFGGFSDYVRVDANWAFPLPPEIPAECAAPLMCAGVTVFAPLLQYDVKPTHRVAVLGMGGLGHLFVQMASKWGCEVTVFDLDPAKAVDAIRFGALRFVDLSKAGEWRDKDSRGYRFDFIASTVYGDLDWALVISLLKADGTLCMIGFPPSEIELPMATMIMKRLRVVGALSGTRYQVQQCLEFCARHRIFPQVELFHFDQVPQVMERFDAMSPSQSFNYRAVIKMPL